MATTTSAIDLTGVINSHDPATLIKDGSRYYQFTTGDGIWYSYSDNLTHWTPGPSTVFNLAGSSDGKTQIRIFNSVGQTLKTGAFSGNKYDLKVSDIPSGMYIVKLENDSCTILKKIKKL